MSRLNNTIRESMANALVKHKFAERAAAILTESVALFKEVYAGLYDEPTRKAMAGLQKKGRAFQTDNDLSVNVRGYRIDIGAITLRHRSGVSWSIQTDLVPMFQEHLAYNEISFLDGEMADRLDAFASARKALIEEVDTAHRKALGTLSQFSTGKKLGAEWPEAMPVIGHLIPEDDRMLPVIQLAAINADFGLPPATKLAA